ncbi:alpha/beta hydrolase [Pedobacter yulinensis]|uniref:Alpha/beta hydrolase n=1 Tax=Pedobacter yulinensis TaxID=2126353 RepID=A0A2T3HPW2_9SPHI|nr:alpha/beta fold hydrolase [Pedobacter yulinensis]PST84484.1 alpha/beta hydrolase [Pedobacter yulinensis]
MIVQHDFSLIGADGKLITGDLTFEEKNVQQPIVLFIHGFKGFKDWGTHNQVARQFAAGGYRYVKFNFSHNGVTPENQAEVTDLETFASNTISKEMFDLKKVIDFILESYSKDNSLYLLGHSRGGGLAILQAATDTRVKKLITLSAIDNFKSLWTKEQEAIWTKTGRIHVTNARTGEDMPVDKTLLDDLDENPEVFDIPAAARKINVPWLIVHGDDDVNVPFAVAQRLADAQPNSRLLKIEKANHVYAATHPHTSDALPAQLVKVVERSLAFLATD